MNGTKPIVLLAFANDREGKFLRSLAGEQQAISQALRDAERAGKCEVLVLSDAGVDDIIQVFKAERGRIKVFHYGGHADGDALLLRSDEKGGAELDAGSFAQFLGQQKGLELVFLNGCATYEQKELLLNAGVKRVIITDQQINDQTAKQFAAQFYESLGTGAGVVQAFGEASAGTKMKQGGVTRAFYWLEKEIEAETGALPWHLYPEAMADDWMLTSVASEPDPPSPSKMRWFWYVAGAVIFLVAGYFVNDIWLSPDPPLPPIDKPTVNQENENLPAWYQERYEPIGFTGALTNDQNQQVDEAEVLVENLKDLDDEVQETMAREGNFVVQLKKDQLGRNPTDSVRFVVKKTGYYTTVQWIGLSQLWQNRANLQLVLLTMDRSQPEPGPANPPKEVRISTKDYQVLSRNPAEYVRKFDLSKIMPAQDLQNNTLTDTRTRLQALKQVSIQVDLGKANRTLQIRKWDVYLDNKKIEKPKVERDLLTVSVLKTTIRSTLTIRSGNLCRSILLVPNKNLKFSLDKDFKPCSKSVNAIKLNQ